MPKPLEKDAKKPDLRDRSANTAASHGLSQAPDMWQAALGGLLRNAQQSPPFPDMATALAPYRRTQQEIESLLAQMNRPAPPPTQSFAKKHPILFGFLSLVPGFAKGYMLRSRMRLMAQQLAEQHRQNLFRDQIALKNLQLKGEISPFQYQMGLIQSMTARRREYDALLMRGLQQTRNDIALQHMENEWKYRQWLEQHPRWGVWGADPNLKLFDIAQKSYSNYLKAPARAMPGDQPLSFDEFTRLNFPQVYKKLGTTGFVGAAPVKPSSLPKGTVLPGDDGKMYLVPDDGSRPYEIPQ